MPLPDMIAELDDVFWDQLLTRMEIQKVIPVVGPGAITFGPSDDLLHPWLAQQVAAKCHLRFPATDLPKTLQQVIDEQRRGGATHDEKARASRPGSSLCLQSSPWLRRAAGRHPLSAGEHQGLPALSHD